MKKESPMVLLTVGMSNSGKSTFARQFVEKNPHFIELNRDDIRIAMFCGGDRSKYVDYRFNAKNEEIVTNIQVSAAETALAQGKGVIISDTNLSEGIRRKWEKLAVKHRKPYKEMPFVVDLHVAKKRNQRRDITLPEEVLENQFVRMRQYLGAPFYTGTPSKPQAIIVDLDGTLFDMTGVRTAFEWDKVHLDAPRPNVVKMVKLLEYEGYKIIFMSGRDSVCRHATWDALEKHVTEPGWLFMRKEGDNRPDCQIKEELFWKYVAPNFDVKFAIDDRDQMVYHWRAMGLECWQVQSGRF